MADLTKEEIAALRALDAAAAKAPWRTEEDWTEEIYGGDGELIGKFVLPRHHHEAMFVVAIRNALPALLAMAERTADIADALYVRRSQDAVKQAKAWADELHALRGRLASWSASYRLIARACDPSFDLEAPFDAKRSNAITDLVRSTIDDLRARVAAEKARADEAEKAYAACAHAIGVEYVPDTGPTSPGPVEAVVAHIREAGRDANELQDAMYRASTAEHERDEAVARERVLREAADAALDWLGIHGQPLLDAAGHEARAKGEKGKE